MAKDIKIWRKTKEFGQKLAKKAKDKTSEQYNKLRQKSFFDDFHLTKGEFVANKELRQLLSLLAYFLLICLLAMSAGELIFCVFAFIYLSEYSYIMRNFAIYSLIKYMGISFLILTVFTLAFLWIIGSYRTAEEELKLEDIRMSNIYIKLSFYASFVLTAILITLLVFCSNYFYDFNEELSKGMNVLVSEYVTNLEAKEQMDRMQWSYDCCGTKSYEDWFQHKIKDDNKNSVPFSCCHKNVTKCHFSSFSSVESINVNGCKDRVIGSLDGLKRTVKWYRLSQMALLFCYIISIDIIYHSLQSEYDAGAHPPVAKFPTFYAVIGLLILIIIYFSTF